MPQLFGEKLRYLRRQHRIVQVELAQQLGLAGQGHITNLETGKDAPSLDLIVRIALLFGVTLDSLLRDTIPVGELEPHTFATMPQAELSLHNFGVRLRALRLQHNLTQVDLARQLHIARQAYISNLESGRKWPSPELVVQIADLFGVTTDELLRSAPRLEADSPSRGDALS